MTENAEVTPVESTEVVRDLGIFLGAAVQLIWDCHKAKTYQEYSEMLDRARANLVLADDFADVAFASVDSSWKKTFQKHIEWCAAHKQERQAIFFGYIRDTVMKKSPEDFDGALEQLELLKKVY